ncbi:restriction endonuclease subunit S [Thermocrinis sp.]|uniref:restriction endonuclease subunit S n=1 Tax=Thermocrinis sp. TaxID=2024383 RepID=UPI002618EB4C|nr:restriction endonuclease subunit S [Thermocrinis sp.]
MADDRRPKEPQGLPEGWKWVKLGEVIEEVKERKGRRNISTVLTVSNTEGLVDQTEFFGRNLSSQDTSNYKVVYKGCFVYNPARINVGSIALNDSYEYAIVSPMYCVFRTKECLLPKYLSYWIQLPNFKYMVINNTAGSVRESLNFSRLITFDFPLPPLPEQRKIAQILETVDNAIEKTEKIIEKYKRIKQGLMQDLLTKGIDEKGNIRSEKTHKFKDSPVGRIPEEWEVVRLGEIVEIYDNKRIPLSEEERANRKGIYPYCGANGIIDHIDNYIFEGEYLLLAEDGGFFGRFENSAYLMSGKFWVNNHAHVLKAREGVSVNGFILAWLIFDDLSRYISGTTRQKLNQSVMKNILIPLPPLSEQKRIAEILSQIDQVIEKEEKYKQKLERLKKGLMEDLLTGKVRVNKLLEGEVNEMA